LLTAIPYLRRALPKWVGFPARSYLDKSGGTSWQPIVELAWSASEARERFRKQALAAIHSAVEHEGADLLP
jgi:hypothetical protein